mmetsp:Transcript_90317/g.292313  ORF Transcript_90317/g.292313 Transcript_90317/m.292313 type:complete len:246 (-) Transcript_90317:179-916(-)
MKLEVVRFQELLLAYVKLREPTLPSPVPGHARRKAAVEIRGTQEAVEAHGRAWPQGHRLLRSLQPEVFRLEGLLNASVEAYEPTALGFVPTAARRQPAIELWRALQAREAHVGSRPELRQVPVQLVLGPGRGLLPVRRLWLAAAFLLIASEVHDALADVGLGQVAPFEERFLRLFRLFSCLLLPLLALLGRLLLLSTLLMQVQPLLLPPRELQVALRPLLHVLNRLGWQALLQTRHLFGALLHPL